MPVIRRREHDEQRRPAGGGGPHRPRRLAFWLPHHLRDDNPNRRNALVGLPHELRYRLYQFLDPVDTAFLSQTCVRFAAECCQNKRRVAVTRTEYAQVAQNAQNSTNFVIVPEEGDWHNALDSMLPPQAEDYPVLCARALSRQQQGGKQRHFDFFVRIANRLTNRIYYQDFLTKTHKPRRRQIVLNFPDNTRFVDGETDFWEACRAPPPQEPPVVLTVLVVTAYGPRLLHCSPLYRHFQVVNDENRWTFRTRGQNVLPNRPFCGAGYAQYITGRLTVDRDYANDTGATTLFQLCLDFFIYDYRSWEADGWSDEGEYECADSDPEWTTHTGRIDWSNMPRFGPNYFFQREARHELFYPDGFLQEEDEDIDNITSQGRQDRRRTRAGTHKHKHRRRPIRRNKMFIPRKGTSKTP